MKLSNDKLLDLTGSRDILERAGMPWVISDTVKLTRQESLRLMELIENPVLRNEKFKRAMADYSEKATHLPDGTAIFQNKGHGADNG